MAKKRRYSPPATRDAPPVSPSTFDSDVLGWFKTTFGPGIVQAAIRQSAWLLCCDIIGQDTAKAPLNLVEKMPDGKTFRLVQPEQHPMARMLALDPNSRHTWYEFKEMIGLWLASESNAYAYIKRNLIGDPLELIPLATGRLPEFIVGSRLYYDVTATTEEQAALLGFQYMRVPEEDIIHVRGRIYDGMNGYSTFSAGRQVLELGEALEHYRTRLFREDGQLRGVFQKDSGAVSEVAFQRLVSQLTAMMRGVWERNRPLVLEDGMKFSAIAVNPKDAQLAEQFDAHLGEFSRLFRMPPHKLFHLTNVKYENIETMEKAYVNDTLIPICTRLEQRYAKRLLSEKDRMKYAFLHDREALTITDTRLETERTIKLAERTLINRDEARARMGYNPIGGDAGKTFLLPVAMMLVDENNEAVQSAAADAAEHAPEPEPADDTGEETDSGSTDKSIRLVSSTG